MRPVPHNGELPVPKPPENLTCSDDGDSHEDNRQHEGANVHCDPAF